MIDAGPDPTAAGTRVAKRLLALAVFMAVLAAPPLLRRIEFDRVNVRVDYVADLQGFREVSRSVSKSDETLLAALAASGVSAVAIRPCSSDQLAADGLLQYLPGAEPGRTRLRIVDPDRFSIASTLSALFPGTRTTTDTVDVPAAGQLFRGTALFLDRLLLQQAHAAGLDVVYRLPNAYWAGPAFLKYYIWMVPEGSTVIFDEEAALGWPANIGLVARAMLSRNLRVGDVEFSGQDGVPELLAAQPLRTVFLHSIPPKELAKLPYSRLMPRWRRAADERNIRHFYLHPLSGKLNPMEGKNIYEASFQYLHELASTMREAGYERGDPVAAGPFLSVAAGGRRGALFRAAASVGAACLALALLALLEPFPLPFLKLAGLALAAVCLASARAASLTAAIASAALSAALFERRTREPRGLLRLAGELALLLGVNYVGGALLYEILSDPAYVMHRAAFSGVKLVYLGPIALVCLELLRRERVRLLATRVLALDLALLAAVGAGGAVYILRSGNFSPVPATQAEQGFRDRLEEDLPARPRTKEFLVGYPALILLAFLSHGGRACRANWRVRLLLLAAGTVAPVSIANSFCHLHSPILLNVKRGLMGLVCGWGAIALLWPLRRAAAIAAGGPYVSLSGYFGFGNLGDEWMLRNQVRAVRDAAGEAATPLVFARRPGQDNTAGAAAACRWSPFEVLAGMALSRVHVSGGGGLFQDVTGPGTVPLYLVYPALARLFGSCRTIFAGQSFGSLSSSLYRQLLCWYACRADLVQARDASSASTLLQWAGEAGEVPRDAGWPEVGTDPVFWYEPRTEKLQESSRILGVQLRPSASVSAEECRQIVQGLRTVAERRGLTLRFLALFPEQDVPFLKGLASASEVVELTPDNATRAFAELAAAVAMRYHAMLLAAWTGVPLLAISYDRKTDFFLDETRHTSRLEPGPSEDLAGYASKALDALLDDPAPAVERLRAWARAQAEAGHAARERFIDAVRRGL